MLPVTESLWAGPGRARFGRWDAWVRGQDWAELDGAKPCRRTCPRDLPSLCPGPCWPLSTPAFALLGSPLCSCLPASPELPPPLPMSLFLPAFSPQTQLLHLGRYRERYAHFPARPLSAAACVDDIPLGHGRESNSVPAEERKARPQDGKELIFLFNEIVFHPCVSSLQSPWT